MRGLLGLVTVVFLLSAAVPDEAPAISRRKQCRQSCGAAIDACVAQGGKRRRCKRQTLRRCRQQGVPTCAVTTTTSPGATTTIPGGGTTTTVAGATTTNPGGSTTTTTLGGGTTTTLGVHGCTLATSTDLRAAPTPTVAFTSFTYTPKCVRIQATQSITFNGDFGFHPLTAGEVVGGVGQPDPSSPIGTSNTSGTSKTKGFPAAGLFPFYCGNHGPGFGMTGAVFVDP